MIPFLTDRELRRFFVSILTNGTVDDPRRLWIDYRVQLSEGFHHPDAAVNHERAMFHIHRLLNWAGKSLSDFALGEFLSAETIAEMSSWKLQNDLVVGYEQELLEDNRVIRK